MAQLFSDAFTRADENPITGWTRFFGAQDAQVLSNTMQPGGATVTGHFNPTGITFPDDQYAQGTNILVDALAQRWGIATRLSGAGGCYYVRPQTSTIDLYRFDNTPAFVSIGSAAVGCTTTDVLRLESRIDKHYVFKNNVLVLGPITDATYVSGRAGVFFTDIGGYGIDNFAAGDLSEIAWPWIRA